MSSTPESSTEDTATDAATSAPEAAAASTSSADDEAQREWLVRLSVQAGIADRGQALRAGFSDRKVAHRLKSGKWQSVHTGVYATFSGPLPREALLWAAVRWAGPGAMLSYETAAEVQGIIDRPAGGSIHVTVPLRRRPAQKTLPRGITVHRSDQSQAEELGPFQLPRTRIEDTVLDLAAAAPTFDHAYAWISRAVSRQLVSASTLRSALAARSRVRWRDWLNDAIEEAGEGIYSSLARHYVTDVESAHGLPKAERQAGRQLSGEGHGKDSWYPEYRVAVEIDGPACHENERVQLDQDRDNANLALDDVKTFRFGPVAVTERACETAAMVAVTLRRSGWPGSPRPCRRPDCAIGQARG